MILMKKFGCASILSGSVMDSYRILSSARCIRDQLPEEHLFVRVEGVDDEAHQLLDVGIECE